MLLSVTYKWPFPLYLIYVAFSFISLKKGDIYKLEGEEVLDIYLKSFQHLPSVFTLGGETSSEAVNRRGSVCVS